MKLLYIFNIIFCSCFLVSFGHSIVLSYGKISVAVLDIIGYSLALIGLFCNVMSYIIHKED